MRRNLFKSGGVLCVIALLLALPGSVLAQEVELKEGMTQGDFALWLIKAIQPELQNLSEPEHASVKPSVNFLVNPAADAEDAVKFLTDQLGLVPEGGWQKKEVLTKEALASLLEKPEEGANLSFDELVEKVLKRVRDKFQEINKKQTVFRVLAPTPSLPSGL